MAVLYRLPGPNADRWDWQLHARCRGMDPDLFFHPDGERGVDRRRRVRRAQAVCARCPVAVECSDHAWAVQEPYGIWGGMSEDVRRDLLERARRQAG